MEQELDCQLSAMIRRHIACVGLFGQVILIIKNGELTEIQRSVSERVPGRVSSRKRKN